MERKRREHILFCSYLAAGFTVIARDSVLLQVAQVQTKHVTQTTKFRPTLVDSAEAKGPNGRCMIDMFQLGVGLENVKNRTICLPEEPERWHKQGGVALRLCRISGHCTQ